MNVKIDDGNAAERVAVNASRVCRAERNVVEEAEAMRSGSRLARSRDGSIRSRMVARRPHSAENFLCAPRHDAINVDASPEGWLFFPSTGAIAFHYS